MHAEIEHPQPHQKTEGNDQHAGQSSHGPTDAMEMGTDVDGHVDLIRAWKQARDREPREELLVGEPAVLLDDDALAPGREPTTERR